ncbi:MAG: cation-transporting P-type ATPase [Chloroflexota bacterium]|nr:cation-transporting P-type ATPase [Chloroflexota bacterium]
MKPPEQPTPPWHALPIDDVLAILAADPGLGLSPAEAARRLSAHGPNQLLAQRQEPWWHEALEALTEPLQLLLIAIGVLYGVLGQLADALTILAVIVVVAGVETANELRAKRAIASLSKLAEPTATVIREGRPAEVAAAELVPGDLLLLLPGMRAAADLRLLETTALRLDESSLTGESAPVHKDASLQLPAETELAERATMAYAGMLVAAGKGRGVVVATGPATELGRLAALAHEGRPARTPLQQSMRQLSGWLLFVAVGFSVLVPVLGVFVAGLPLQTMLLTGLTLAFATVPEELPILITIVLGIGAYRLARRHAIVRRLQAAETLGSVSVIATDKTGTVTENRMVLSQLIVGETERPLADAAADPLAGRLLQAAALASDAQPVGSEGKLEFVGDPTEAALLAGAEAAGLNLRLLREQMRIVEEHPFDDRRKRMSAVCDRAGRRFLSAKGAPESILAICSHIAGESEPQPLGEADRTRLGDILEAMAARGTRVLAVAERPLPPHDEPELPVEAAERDMTLLGFVGFEDPPRPEARASVLTLQAAGVRVVMLTGDHPSTARAIAQRVGINADRLAVGRDLDALSAEATARRARNTAVFARIAPEHKLRIVRALQAQGEVVAVTGDGVNDAPALREAAIGVAMGRTGTDVAREAADLILADDNFATVAAAVEAGRTLYANLWKAVRFYLAVKVALVSASLIAVLLRLPVPFAPVQIIVMELFMDVGASATFVADPPERNLMLEPPRNPNQPFMGRAMQLGIGFGGLSLGAAVLLAYAAAFANGADPAAAQTAAFVTWMIGHVVLAAHMRTERQPLLRTNILANRAYVLWALGALAVVVLGTIVPPIAQRLHLASLAPATWLPAVVSALLLPSWWELWKWLWPGKYFH